MADESSRLSLRIHDECNGSDVFGSDICTCRPYLIFGIEEAVKEAQNGGSGVVIYFRKEGRALGEVTKIRAISILSLSRVTELAVSMSKSVHLVLVAQNSHSPSHSMKHDAIVGQGIPILERVELPEELIPADSRVEIDAKINAGYFTAGKRLTAEDLQSVQGRMWEDIDH
ncbi:GTP cyclohydrolase II, RibA [Moelleriella libera RCEF 2490]|uniref:GTP cyclohydrolase II, RibA n=1 Tax=Moelleriella libera RCEF 2490 TaxID=1081109 RepID=A0A168F0K9_9HYPO|nr:GTP cyclohydrolase II, RibA [Moelleriella libera RCEF 2490]